MQKAPFYKILGLLESTEKPNIELALNIAKYHYREEFEEYFGFVVEDYHNLYENFYKNFLYNENNILEIENLDLSNKKLKKIPRFVFSLINLKHLNLGNNQLQSIPDEIGQLNKLQILDLRNNQIEIISSEIGQLQNLKIFNLKNNLFQTFPKIILQLQSLRELNLRSNQITNIPSEIEKLQSLEELNVYNNPLKTLPIEIGNLKKLWRLKIKTNTLQALPFSINYKKCNLTKKEIIILGFKHLEKLYNLDLSDEEAIRKSVKKIFEMNVFFDVAFWGTFIQKFSNKIKKLPEIKKWERFLFHLEKRSAEIKEMNEKNEIIRETFNIVEFFLRLAMLLLFFLFIFQTCSNFLGIKFHL